MKTVAFLLVFLVSGAWPLCENPEVSSTTYTTDDATVLSHIAYISDFSVKCTNGEVSNLHVLMGDSIQPVAVIGPNRYQVSWVEEVNKARIGEINVKIFDDDGFALIRKAQRNGEDVSKIAPLTALTINHPGIYKGPWVSCEFLAVTFSIFVSYCAIHFRTKLNT